MRKHEVSLEGNIVKAFCDICRKHAISAVPNLYLMENGSTYNASIFIDKYGKIIGIQKMVHVAQAEQLDLQETKKIRNAKSYTQLRRTEFYL